MRPSLPRTARAGLGLWAGLALAACAGEPFLHLDADNHGPLAVGAKIGMRFSMVTGGGCYGIAGCSHASGGTAPVVADEIRFDPPGAFSITRVDPNTGFVEIRAEAEGDCLMQIEHGGDSTSHQLQALEPDRVELGAGLCAPGAPLNLLPAIEVTLYLGLFQGAQKLDGYGLWPLELEGLELLEQPDETYQTLAYTTAASFRTPAAPQTLLARSSVDPGFEARLAIVDPAAIDELQYLPPEGPIAVGDAPRLTFEALVAGEGFCRYPQLELEILTPELCSLDPAGELLQGTDYHSFAVYARAAGTCRVAVGPVGSGLVVQADFEIVPAS